MKDLEGRTAIVTGASRGLGVYVARALSDHGMNLVLAARTAPALDDLVGQLLSRGRGGAISIPTDVSRLEDLERLVAKSQTEFGAVDVLVNNAGIEGGLTYHKLDLLEIDEVIDVNLRATMRLTWMVLPGMVERRRGHIVNMSSLAGRAGPAFMEAYAATKAGLIGFTQSLRNSYRRQGVSASVVCPGFVGEAGMYADWRRSHEIDAPKRLGLAKPQAVANAVVKALRDDLPEVIVNPLPVRPLLALLAVAPGVAEKISRSFDANEFFRRQAYLRERERDAERPGRPIQNRGRESQKRPR